MNNAEDENGGFDMPHDFRGAILSAVPGTVWRGDGVVVNLLRTGRGGQTNVDKVREFQGVLWNGKLPAKPLVPNLPLLWLCQGLIAEEYDEAMTEFVALDERMEGEEVLTTADIAPLMHELADLLYVTYGAMLSFGVDPDAVFAEVHEANMRKLAGPRREDGKILKPEGWEPADVAAVISRLSAST